MSIRMLTLSTWSLVGWINRQQQLCTIVYNTICYEHRPISCRPQTPATTRLARRFLSWICVPRGRSRPQPASRGTPQEGSRIPAPRHPRRTSPAIANHPNHLTIFKHKRIQRETISFNVVKNINFTLLYKTHKVMSIHGAIYAGVEKPKSINDDQDASVDL